MIRGNEVSHGMVSYIFRCLPPSKSHMLISAVFTAKLAAKESSNVTKTSPSVASVERVPVNANPVTAWCLDTSRMPR